jgi:hypothetical protein
VKPKRFSVSTPSSLASLPAPCPLPCWLPASPRGASWARVRTDAVAQKNASHCQQKSPADPRHAQTALAQNVEGSSARAGGVPLIFPRAKPQIVWSILRLLFLATIVALRLTLRLLIGLAAWLLGAYVQLPPRGARARE